MSVGIVRCSYVLLEAMPRNGHLRFPWPHLQSYSRLFDMVSIYPVPLWTGYLMTLSCIKLIF
uniref:Uncharacterized protein n=1 Tax=Anguilla anguilla TaxID=7936 RepID=A0A0E9VL35_ANGAN